MTNSSEVKRMQCGITCVPECCRMEGKDCDVPTDTDMVLASDFDRVQRERDEEVRKHAELAIKFIKRGDTINELRAQLDAARADIERLTLDSIHTCHDDCRRPVCRLTRELNAARAEVVKTEAVAANWRSACDQARAEVARLRGAIENCNGELGCAAYQFVDSPLPGGEGR